MSSDTAVRAAEQRVEGLVFERDPDGRPNVGGVLPWQGWARLGERHAYFRLRSNSATLEVHAGPDDDAPIWKSSRIYPVYGDPDDPASVEEHAYDGHVEDDFLPELVSRLVAGLRPVSWTNPTFSMRMDRSMLDSDAMLLAATRAADVLGEPGGPGPGTDRVLQLALGTCRAAIVETLARRGSFSPEVGAWVLAHLPEESDQPAQTAPSGPAWVRMCTELMPYVASVVTAALATEVQRHIDGTEKITGPFADAELVVEWLTSEHEVETARFRAVVTVARAEQAR